ncbi:integumentary mucin C.1-like [Dreissena polymorpha]|uniref:Integumentary mucin C.1-like n=1 Tax=Dreissena polymorpha TaxID=45954 RepID=A0A9D4CJZ4_DREPO|nr:integumentary mucin C.1-like [Dreissena polymorpha]KAH3726735.1 hypothetical protein DPMN_052604 [Dreissena polymorpha]
MALIMSALNVTVVCLVLIGQVLTREILVQNCIHDHDKNTCSDGYCCVRDEFLSTRTYCRQFGQASAPCSTQPTDYECPCAPGYRCATDAEGHITSLFGRCYAIPENTTTAPTTPSTTTSTTPTSPTTVSTTTTTTTTTTTPTLTAPSSTTINTTTASTTPVLTTTTTELPTTSVSTNTTFSTQMLTTTTLNVPTKAVIIEDFAPETNQNSFASTGSEVVNQKSSDPLNIIVPIG